MQHFCTNNLKFQDYNNVTLQGLKTNVVFIYARASYEFFPNIYFDVLFRQRKESNTSVNQSSTTLLGGLRMNFEPRRYKF
jgi:hypothetical protein